MFPCALVFLLHHLSRGNKKGRLLLVAGRRHGEDTGISRWGILGFCGGAARKGESRNFQVDIMPLDEACGGMDQHYIYRRLASIISGFLHCHQHQYNQHSTTHKTANHIFTSSLKQTNNKPTQQLNYPIYIFK
jgi:hypothetical protein